MTLETRNTEFRSQGKHEEGTANRGDAYAYVRCTSLTAVNHKHNCSAQGEGEMQG
jgi:hypothetical protein